MTKHFNSEGTGNINADFKEILKENQAIKKALEYQENQNKILKNNIEILEKNVKRLSEKIDDLLDEMQDIYNNNWSE